MSEDLALHRRSGALLLMLLTGMAAYGLSYALGGLILFYLPVGGHWTFHPGEGAIRVSYYGLLLNGVVGAAAGWGIGLIPGVSRWLARGGVVRFLSRAAMFLFLLIWGSIAVLEARHWLVPGQTVVNGSPSGQAEERSADMVDSLQVGDQAPGFRLQDAEGRWITRDELLREGPLVIFFYPRDETPGCTAQACGFQSSLHSFTELGATVVGVSADSVGSHRAFADHRGLTYPLLSDPNGEAREAFRVPRVLGLLPGRTTYVIDAKGAIRHVHHGQLDPVEHVQVALEAIRQL